MPEKELILSLVDNDKFPENQTLTDLPTRPTITNSGSLNGSRTKPLEEAKNWDPVIS